METKKIIIESLKQTIIELRDENYRSNKYGLAKAALDFVEILEEALILPVVGKSVKENTKPTSEEWANQKGFLQIETMWFNEYGGPIQYSELSKMYKDEHQL
jgi:hypothetical protein